MTATLTQPPAGPDGPLSAPAAGSAAADAAAPTFPCPLCKASVPEGQSTCPRCNEDLEPLLVVDQLAVAHYNEGLRLAQQGRLDQAAEHLGTALAFNPGLADALVVMGKINAQLDRLDDAIAYWRRAMEHAPGDERAARGIAAAQAKQRRARRRARLRAAALPGAGAVGLLLGTAVALGVTTPQAPPPTPTAVAASPAAGSLVLAAQAALHVEPMLSSQRLAVTQTGATLVLAGTVASPEQRARAEELVKAVAGVAAVDSTSVRLSAPPPQPPQPPPPAPSDQHALADAVRGALMKDGATASLVLDVQQVGTGVRLVGITPSAAVRDQAEALARAVPGVDLVDVGGVRLAASADAAVYVVRPGDTLTAIAGYAYGDPARWREVFDANRDRISRPDLVIPGTRLVLPGMTRSG